MSRELKSNRHSIYSLKFHLVVITKYREEKTIMCIFYLKLPPGTII